MNESKLKGLRYPSKTTMEESTIRKDAGFYLSVEKRQNKKYVDDNKKGDLDIGSMRGA